MLKLGMEDIYQPPVCEGVLTHEENEAKEDNLARKTTS
jgi:hypothetical protein